MPKNARTISIRAVLIGLILIPINAYWITIVSELWDSMNMTASALFFNAVFNLFCLVLINLCLQRFLPKLAFSRSELLIIYVMLVMLSTICGHTMMTFLIGTLTHPFWFATPENEYAGLFNKYIPSWFTVQDKTVLMGFFEGDSTIYTTEHLKAWLTPVLVWSGIIFALFFIFICINIIIRKQWVEQDRLSYPIVQVPIEITAPGSMTRKLFWFGFAISALIEIINGIHYLYPAIPGIPLLHNYYGFTEKPWNAIGYIKFSFYPFVIGLTFFAPLGLAFSVWFFYILIKAQQVISSIWGTRSLPGFPYYNEQGLGAWITLGILVLWMSRRHLSQVCRKILGCRSTLDDSTEPMRYRFAFLGLILGMTFLVLLLHKAGLSLSLMPLYFSVYFLMSIAITRVRAALGPPFHEIVFTHPQRLMVDVMGTRFLGAGNLTILSFLYPFNRDNSAHPMPSQLEAFKIAERTGTNNKHILWGIVPALVVSILASFWAYLHVMYKYGATAKAHGFIHGIGNETFRQLASWLQYPQRPDYPAVLFIGFGSVFITFLMAMQRRFIWWPFHPAGYALGMSWGMIHVWMSVFVGWSIKGIMLKFGGLKAYRRGVPFFIGIILGDYTIACIWTIIGASLGIPTYRVWP